MCSNAPLIMSVQSSGSSCSAAAVDPLTSQNNIVTTRRSPISPPPEIAAFNFLSSSLGIYCWSLDCSADVASAERGVGGAGAAADTTGTRVVELGKGGAGGC